MLKGREMETNRAFKMTPNEYRKEEY